MLKNELNKLLLAMKIAVLVFCFGYLFGLGHSLGALTGEIFVMGTRHRVITQEEKDKVVKLYLDERLTIEIIHSRMGLSRKAISDILKEREIPRDGNIRWNL